MGFESWASGGLLWVVRREHGESLGPAGWLADRDFA